MTFHDFNSIILIEFHEDNEENTLKQSRNFHIHMLQFQTMRLVSDVKFSKKSRKTKKKKMTKKRQFLRKTSFCPNRFFFMVFKFLRNLSKTRKFATLRQRFIPNDFKYLLLFKNVDKIFLALSKYLKILYKVPHMHNFFLLAFEVQILTKILRGPRSTPSPNVQQNGTHYPYIAEIMLQFQTSGVVSNGKIFENFIIFEVQILTKIRQNHKYLQLFCNAINGDNLSTDQRHFYGLEFLFIPNYSIQFKYLLTRFTQHLLSCKSLLITNRANVYMINNDTLSVSTMGSGHTLRAK
ncbi:hypothetical protein AGLY_002884 [Aphis glycines]|uniref:Uncharacterized protein n=1 Tax=Aphis glycines TaxID=307491 RepID=A0A6G0U209_APHGL|nr:hypothetical protein AGLY_002884 [Aphis glycines]